MRKLFILHACLSMMITAMISKAFAQDDPGARGPVYHCYALIVGISNYKYIRPLSFADKDAQLFRDFLQSPGGGSLPDDNIFCLLNEDARAANFWVKGMSWLRSKQLKKGDRLYIYLAGHGDAISSDEYFFLTYDCNPAGDKNNYIVTGNIQLFNLKSRIAALTGSGVEVLLIMDACRSNELPGGAEGQRFLSTAVSEQRAGETVMLAAAAGQESIEDSRIGTGHGLFTYYLIDGLSGLADKQGNGMITLSKIQSWVTGKVETEARQKYRHDQRPYFCCTATGDKVIARVDSAFLREWTAAKQLKTQDNDLALRSIHGRSGSTAGAVVDTQLVELYNRFTDAVKRTDLIGDSSADTWYRQMADRFPHEPLTADARYNLVTEWIDFAQQRINLMLEDKDSVTIRRMREELGRSGQSRELQERMTSLQKITTQENGKIADMLGRAIELIGAEDSALARSLLPKYYYYKALASTEVVKGNKYDVTTARRYMSLAYSLDTGSAYLQLGFADIYMNSGRYDSAVYYGLRAIQKAPRWATAYTKVGSAYTYMGSSSFQKARHYLLKALALDPKNYVIVGNMGTLEIFNVQLDSGAMYFRQMIQLEPEHAEGYLAMGCVKLMRGSFDSANQYYQRAIAIDPNRESTYRIIGSMYSYFGGIRTVDSAKKYFRLALFRNPSDALVYGRIGDLAYQMEMPADTTLYYLRLANTLDPQLHEPYITMANVYAENGMVDSALAMAHRALALNRSADGLYTVGYVHTFGPHFRDSTAAYWLEAAKTDTTYSSPYDALGLLRSRKGDYDTAIILMRHALKIEPANGIYLEHMANIYNMVGQKDSAVLYYRTARRYSFTPWRIEARIANLFATAGERDSALFHLHYAAVTGTHDFETLEVITICFNILGLKDSIPRYLDMLKVEPGNKEHNHLWIGMMYTRIGQYDSAIAYLQRTVDERIYADQGVSALGLVYLKQRNFDKALAAFLLYTREYPDNYGVDYNIACAYSLQDNKPEAISWLERSIQGGYRDYKHIMEDTDLVHINQDPAFAALMKKYFPTESAK
jgi:tetratricopeptide (TPR) repeat protein